MSKIMARSSGKRISRDELIEDLKRFQNNKRADNRFASKLYVIAERTLQNAKFRHYDRDTKDDMISLAMTYVLRGCEEGNNKIQGLHNFDINKGTSPYSYITQSFTTAYLQILEKRNKDTALKGKLFLDNIRGDAYNNESENTHNNTLQKNLETASELVDKYENSKSYKIRKVKITDIERKKKEEFLKQNSQIIMVRSMRYFQDILSVSNDEEFEERCKKNHRNVVLRIMILYDIVLRTNLRFVPPSVDAEKPLKRLYAFSTIRVPKKATIYRKKLISFINNSD